jgi:hypothetical protein
MALLRSYGANLWADDYKDFAPTELPFATQNVRTPGIDKCHETRPEGHTRKYLSDCLGARFVSNVFNPKSADFYIFGI